ncbi:hypothetical protein LSTR_LSTR005331 [Laodelphax striatellus]|uniref:2',5'-phosphodiesterase 12 n=2 Tax=Laodelphax striatellus TaxID=195883 RepID=A0A482X7J7_LAOST|nr:hypothetical protein LSTR_LSTR005331 [Laodelphax striatellus]
MTVFLWRCRALPAIIRSYSLSYKTNLKAHSMEKPTAYFRLTDGYDTFQVSFLFKNETLNIERECNFNRKLDERVGDFLNRVKVNIDKLKSSKRKNKKQKVLTDLELDSSVSSAGLFQDGTLIDSETICRDAIFCYKSAKNLSLNINDVQYSVSINAPWVNELCLPSSMLAGFFIYPSKFNVLFSEQKDCSFTWFRKKCKQAPKSDDPGWQKVGEGFVYTVENEDVGYYLKLTCVPSNNELKGPEASTVSSGLIEAGPGLCPFEDRHPFTQNRLSGNEFRVMTYNILSDIYTETAEALSHLFHYCPRYALKIDYRKQLLIKEILGYNADLIFLQEVDDWFFNRDLKYVLGLTNYEGCYAQKGSTVREGVACFYSKDRFRLLHSESIILGEEIQNNPCLSELWEVIGRKEALKLRVIERHTTLQILTLESLDKSDELLVVANTHLYFHPDADHVRLIQGGIAMKYITEYIGKLKKETPNRNVSLIFCGDFNSVPECGIYKLMTTGLVPEDYIDWNSNKEEAVEGLSLSQPWKIASACGTPQFTNFIQEFSGCLDYIFYQTDRLAVTQVVPLPTEEELRQHTALPSVVFPSDHIALIADLRWSS